MRHKSYHIFNEMDEHDASVVEEVKTESTTSDTITLEVDYSDFDKNGYAIDAKNGYAIVKTPETNDRFKHAFRGKMYDKWELFNKNGKFANLNNLAIRATTFNILRERLIQHFVAICKEDAEKQCKSRTHFCLYESALRWLTQFLDDENHIVGKRQGKEVKLNTKQLKFMLNKGDYELSNAQSTALIKLAKKADIIRQKGRGDNSYFIMNPVFSNGAYVGKISRKVLIEFNESIKGLFTEKQYTDCMIYLANNDELPKELVKELNLDEQ